MFIVEIIIEFLLWILIEVIAITLLSYPGATIIWLFQRPKMSIRQTRKLYRFRSFVLSVGMWTAVIFMVIKLW